MLLLLLPIFLFSAAMAGGAALFCGRYLFPELTPRTLARIRNGFFAAGILFPLLYFSVYMLAQPKEDDGTAITPQVAAIPATWIGLILLGIAVGLTLAPRKQPSTLRHRSPARDQ